MLSRAEQAALQTLMTRSYTLRVCGDAWVAEGQSGMLVSPRTGFREMQSLARHHLWMQPPVDCVGPFLQHYAAFKQASPHDVSACIAVPRWLGQRWRRHLRGMQLLKQHSKGSRVCEPAGSDQPPAGSGRALPWDFEVWYDPPAPMISAAALMRCYDAV